MEPECKYVKNWFLIKGNINYPSIFEALKIPYTCMSNLSFEEMSSSIRDNHLNGKYLEYFRGTFNAPTFKCELVKLEPMQTPKHKILQHDMFNYEVGDEKFKKLVEELK